MYRQKPPLERSMTSNSLFELIRRLQQMSKDLEYLESLDDSKLLTDDMKAYKQEIHAWLGILFTQVHDEVDKYMSTLKKTNPKGFLRPLTEEGSDGFLRAMSNFQHLPTRPSANSINDPLFTQHRALQRQLEPAQQAASNNNYNNGLIDGMAAGYFVLQDSSNNVITEEDYFNQPYEDDGVDPPEIDSNYSETGEDFCNSNYESPIDDEMPLF